MDDQIPTIDLSPLTKPHNYNEEEKNKLKEVITNSCSQYGFFQIVNHGVPLDLLKKALKLSETFFAYSDEEKLKCAPCPGSGAPLPAGYSKQPPHSADKNEYLMMFPPHSNFNVLPSDPPGFKESLEEMFTYLVKTGLLIENILNDCLDLPQGFLKEYNHERGCDFMVALRYFPASEVENNGLSEHEDGNIVTLVVQDETGGLEVYKDGKWIPVIPSQDAIVVNIGDVVQVLTNNKFKSATHRVVRPRGRSRHSFAFFYNLHGEKWVEPLPHFTKEIGEPAKYRGFFHKDYLSLRMKNKTHPPSRSEDVIHISHYAIPNA